MRTRCTGASSVSSVKRLRSSWGKTWASAPGDSALPIQKLPAGTFPNMSQAGDYSGLLHYLKAVKELGVEKAKASGRETVAMMKRLPTDDDAFGLGSIRADGRKIHPAYLFQVKPPEESWQVGDIYKLVSTIGAEEAFRPIADGGCPITRS